MRRCFRSLAWCSSRSVHVTQPYYSTGSRTLAFSVRILVSTLISGLQYISVVHDLKRDHVHPPRGWISALRSPSLVMAPSTPTTCLLISLARRLDLQRARSSFRRSKVHGLRFLVVVRPNNAHTITITAATLTRLAERCGRTAQCSTRRKRRVLGSRVSRPLAYSRDSGPRLPRELGRTRRDNPNRTVVG